MQFLKGDFAAHLSLHDKVLLVAFVLLKVALVVALPLTGDEAYFIGWGQNLASGYYDHPPAVGWVLFGLSTLADNLYWYRSFALFTSVVVAYVLYRLVRLNHNVSPVVAFYVGLVFFVSPVSLMFVLTANDTVLVLFGLVGGYFFAHTVLPDSLHSPQSSYVLNSFKTLTLWPILAGLFLGMAFLSKYFAAFVLLGLLLWTFSHYKTVPWRRVTVMVLIVLGFVAQNLYFNATQCWNNILFNFFSRTAQSAFSWTDLVSNVALYGLMLVLMLSPLGVVYWVKAFKNSHKNSPQNSLLESSSLNLPGLVKRQKPYFDAVSTLALYASVPLLLVLLVVSFSHQIGLHWPLIAVAWLFVLYSILPVQKLVVLYRFNAYSALLLGGMLLVALGFVDKIVPESQRAHIALYTQPQALCAQLPQSTFFTLDYSSQSALAYHCQNDAVHVFASTSKFGREDDKWVDFKALNQQNLTILITQKKELTKLAEFFSQLEVKELPMPKHADSTHLTPIYFLVTGIGFDYAAYKQAILQPVATKYYTAPDWFPKTVCPFKAHYDLR